jgi:hypothetical protein
VQPLQHQPLAPVALGYGFGGDGGLAAAAGAAPAKDEAEQLPEQVQVAGLMMRVAAWGEPKNSLLRFSVRVLLPRRPALACGLNEDSLLLLSSMQPELALLALHQLLLCQVPGGGGAVPGYLAQCASLLCSHFRVQPGQGLDALPQLWRWIAGGEVGQGVPYFVSVWQGPQLVKAWLQVRLTAMAGAARSPPA